MDTPTLGGHSDRFVCSCGTVIAQCRCMHPKRDRVMQDACTNCQHLKEVRKAVSSLERVSQRIEEARRIIRRE